MATGALTPESAHHKSFWDEGSGVLSWALTTDHKRIAFLYLWSILAFFCVGMLMGFLMRLELIAPGVQIVGGMADAIGGPLGIKSAGQMYNSILTLHGVIMIFLVIIPSIPATFGNFFLPIMLGANDVFFPKINLVSWYCLIIGALLAVTALFSGYGPPDTGWTFYAPFSTDYTQTNVSLSVFAAFVIGFSSILTGLNFIATVHCMRAPGMGWFKMPLFVWGLYATAWIQVLATPVVGITLMMIVGERMFGLGLFDPTKGGDPILYQHLFWIYSHPAVYVMVLPAMGIVSEIIPTFCKKRIFGYKFIAYSSVAIAAIGSLVWGHHMFTSGMSGQARRLFSFLTFFVSIPSAIKVFNWIATMYKGSIELSPPMLMTMMFMVLFMIGGFTGLMQASVAPDVQYHDTYFVVAHFHYVMFGSAILMFFAGLHYWYPKMSGKMYSMKTAYWTTLGFFIGFNLTYFPMFILGHRGMPRRYYDYDPKFTIEHACSTVGSWILIASILVMFWNIFIWSRKHGKQCPKNPWGGVTFEWQTESPPVLHNFEKMPDAHGFDPYDYSEYAYEQHLKLKAEREKLSAGSE